MVFLGALALPAAASATPSSPVAALAAPSGGGGISGGDGGSSNQPEPISLSGGGSFFPPAIEAPKHAATPSTHGHGKWIRGFTVTEYWPAPEAWFVGRRVRAPGLPGRHRIDWLYSAMGLSMEGDGFGMDGRQYHIDSMGDGGWVTSAGRSTSASNEFAAGSPFWRAGGYWRNRRGGVTFPLAAGGWYAGPGRRYVPLRGVSFAPGPSLPLHFWQSIAVDPGVIPIGSRVYIPAYRDDGHGGWFVARDTGGAINGHRIDVYRKPPKRSSIGGRYLVSQKVLVIKP
ncbi:MAG: 3D domain-containing protein [Solirubrobacteraceae bacterium]